MSISPEHQSYIQQKVNPLLEAMVTAVLLEKPTDPVPFMIDWLKTKNGSAGTEKALKDELESLKNEIKDMEKKMKAGEGSDSAPASANDEKSTKVDADSDPETEDDDDDVVEDFKPPPGYAAKMGKMRASVSAEAYGKWNVKKEYVPVVIEKTDEQKQRLKEKLGLSFMFQALEDAAFNVVIDAMEEVKLTEGTRIITKGDDGDCMYVVDSGFLDCKIVKPDGDLLTVKTVEEGDVFGELALLYNCPRAAHVDSRGDTVVWKLDRACFQGVVLEAAVKKREAYEGYVGKVSLFESMSGYEKGQMADALQAKSADKDSDIIVQGEPGNDFFVLLEGAAVAVKDGVEVKTYGSGDYFGELALLKNEPRAATVKATENCKLATLDRKTFKRLLGPLQQIMDRNAAAYSNAAQ